MSTFARRPLNITTVVGDLSQLEVILADDTVKWVCELQVSCNAAASHGICIAILDRRLLKEPAPVPRKEPDCDEEPDGDDDDEYVDLGADANSDDRDVVDTDLESSGTGDESGTSSDDGVVDDKAVVMKQVLRLTAATGVHPTTKATGDPRSKSGLRPLWGDEYFIIGNHARTEFVRIKVRKHYTTSLDPHHVLSKQIFPHDHGETRDDPVRCILVLRAWSLWRAGVAGWGDARDCRRKHFDEQQACLERDVKRFMVQRQCRSLGNSKANDAFTASMPEMGQRVLFG